MGDLYEQTPKKLFYISANGNYGNCKLSTTGDQQFRRFISPTGVGSGTSGAYVPTMIYYRIANASSPGGTPTGGIYTAASKGGTPIVAAATTWGVNNGDYAAPLNLTYLPNPYAGGTAPLAATLCTGTPYLYLDTAGTGTIPVTIWIFGHEVNEGY